GVKIFDLSSGRMIVEAEATSETRTVAKSLKFSPHGRQLVSVHQGAKLDPVSQFVVLWNVGPQGALQKTHTLLAAAGHDIISPWSVPYIEFTPDGKSIVSGSTDGVIYV